MSKYIYGIDFGTTNSAISIININTNEIEKTFNVGSLIYIPQPTHGKGKTLLECFVGEIAIEKYVENNMKGRFIKSIKRVLPRSGFKETRIYGHKFTAEDLVCIIIKYLKDKADKFIEEDIQKAVLGRPVVFDEDTEKDMLAQERLLGAAKKAGFSEIAFQMEPIAAAFTYERIINKDETVLVADFGGGTSDFTLMNLSPNKLTIPNRKKDIIGQTGIYIGGDNFDSSIMWDKGTYHFGRGLTYENFETILEVPRSFFLNICSWEKMNFFDSNRLRNALGKFYYLTGKNPRFKNLISLVENNLGYSIFKSIEEAKIGLSSKEVINFKYQSNGIEINEPITLEEFTNEVIDKDLNKIKEHLNVFLKESGIKKEMVDTVFLTGGTSLVAPIRIFMEDMFGDEAVKSGDNFNSVANGLAYSHVLFFK